MAETARAAGMEEELFAKERSAIDARRAKADSPYADEGKTWGLALSGGGIRSATFCLGMAKSLANNNLLTRFDYLSTVSGGGYAGAALGRLFQHVGDPAKVQAGLGRDDTLFWWWLRSNGRYLLPAGAKDTLFAVSTHVRGLVAIYFDLLLVGLLAACLIVLPHVLGLFFVGGVYDLVSWAKSTWWLFATFLPLIALTLTWAYWVSKAEAKLRIHSAALLFVVCSAVLLVLIGFMQPPDWWCKDVARVDSGYEKWWTSALCLSNGAAVVAFTLLASIPLATLVAVIVGARTRDEGLARNWLTRFLTYCLYAALALAAMTALDIVSWQIAKRTYESWPRLAAGGAGFAVLLVLLRALLSWLRDRKPGEISFNMVRMAKIAGFVMAALVMLFCVTVVQSAVFFGTGFSLGDPESAEARVWATESLLRWAWIFTPALLYVGITGRNMDSLNWSSLHNFYRARLTRSYLGLGNPARGFDADALEQAGLAKVRSLRKVSEVVPGDDLPLDGYRPDRAGGPIHLVNVCLNQTIDDQTGQFNRDRNGRNMTVSGLGMDVGTAMGDAGLRFEGRAPTLGQWIAISGAAAAPGMGALTSKGLAALMTFGGVRLGYWLRLAGIGGRPVRASFTERTIPKYSHLLDEMMASFPSLERPHWYASDGGHFENTGIYALLKRKVDLIVAADCGADPRYDFGDLNNLCRLARIDFNARITFLEVKPLEPGAKEQARGGTEVHAVQAGKTATDIEYLSLFGTPKLIAKPDNPAFLVRARIDYDGGKVGHLVILKPAIVESAPLDIQAYKAANPAFPQQSTGDQFFDEAQWESYFRLGEKLGASLQPAVLTGLEDTRKRFRDQAGMGVVEHVPVRTFPAPEEKPAAARGVVSSSLGVGAIAGLLITLWQHLDAQKNEAIADRRVRAEALAKALERSFAPNGDLQLSEGGILVLRSVLNKEQVERGDVDLTIAQELLGRLRDQCLGKGTDSRVCNDIRDMGRLLTFRSAKGSEVAYWGDPPKPVEAPAKPAPVVPAALPKAEPPKPVPPAPTVPAKAPAEPVSPCASEGRKTVLYTHVYDDAEGDKLKAFNRQEALPTLIAGSLTFVPVENVVASAQREGTRPPYLWARPTFIYHNESDAQCAQALAALFESFARVPAQVRPLPARLRKQPATIELWVPPRALDKVESPRT